jgi:uncharacterized protein YggE
LLLVASIATPVGAETPPGGSVVPPHPPAIVVLGRGKVQAAPDRAFVSLAVESRDASPQKAQAKNAATMTAVRTALGDGKVPSDAIRTLGYQLAEEVDWQNGKRVSRGYLARNTVEVRLDDVTRVGEVIDIATRAGANNVTDVRFDLRDRASTEREALRLAVADAFARAEAAAAGAKLRLGAIQRISEQSARFEPPRPFMAARMEAADAAAAPPSTPIEAGQIEVESEVTLTVAIAE